MSETNETPQAQIPNAAATDPLLDRNATLAELTAHWESLASKPGTVEAGRVVEVGEAELVIEVAAGRGRVAVSELRGGRPAVGETLRVFIEQVLTDGPVLSLTKARGLDLYDRLEAAADRDEPVEGVVLARVKGGLSVDIGLKAFLPDRRTDAPLGEGQKSRFWVREWDERKDTFLLAREPRSARDVREARKSRPREVEAVIDGEPGAESVAPAPVTPVTMPTEGEILEGRVARLADFGAFVELPGGATGLLHVKDMSWGRVQHPADVVAIGDKVEVKVLKIQASGEGGKGDKIQLSRRVLLPAPWATVSDRLRVGQKVSGPVISFADYGAFVEIEPGVEGMVHVSEIGWGNPKHPSDALNVGERVEAEIIHLDPEKKHLKLSIKKLKGSPFAALREKFPVGTRVQGVVKNIASFGVFVTLDAENGFEGLVHTSDLSWAPVGKVAEHFPVGREVEALVLGIDEERGRCSLGIKQLTAEPVRPSLDAFSVGQTLEGKVMRVKDFGAFIELAPGIEGLAHAGEMGLAEGQKPRDKVKVGQRVRVTIASLDAEARRIGLVIDFPEAAPPAVAAPPAETEPPAEG
jgi:small subunit ribosomal protein S1